MQRTYYADVEDQEVDKEFIYRVEADSDEEAIIKFRRVFGDRVEMISFVGENSKVCIYEKPELFGRSKAEKLVDYKELLKAYIMHITNEEGIPFIYAHIDKSDQLSKRQYEEMISLCKELSMESRLVF